MSFEPVHVRARFDGHTFVPETPVDLPVGTVIVGLVEEKGKERPRRQPGSAKGLPFYMSEDFDAPLKDFAEYM
ncbi:DUF2281 domain-containing protein [bacterium]|nr:MAG: DUF2281 domain-containing protein [bacterium]